MLTYWAVILWENAPKGHPLGHTLGHPLGPIPFRKPSSYHKKLDLQLKGEVWVTLLGSSPFRKPCCFRQKLDLHHLEGQSVFIQMLDLHP